MQIQHQSKDGGHTFSAGRQLMLFFGFVSFITGLFSLAYALLASYLLPYSHDISMIALSGLVAAYVGRKMLRRNGKEITL